MKEEYFPNWGDNIPLSFEMWCWAIKDGTIPQPIKWSKELEQELKSMFALDIEQELDNIMREFYQEYLRSFN